MLRKSMTWLVFAAASFVVPAHAQICTPFTDVPAADPFCTNIQWMFNRGVTLGCLANQYCPAQFVRRDQMAAFMNRLADRAVFQQGGNAFESAGAGTTAILGTTNAQPLDIRVNNARVMRYEPSSGSPSVIGGSAVNNVATGVRGATIGGGGELANPNQITFDYGTIAGGTDNRAGPFATVGGGLSNTASGFTSTVAGGGGNTASATWSSALGGSNNVASGQNSIAAGKAALADRDFCAIFSLWTASPGTRCGTTSIFRVGGEHGFTVDYFSQRPDSAGDRWVYIGDTVSNQTIATWTGAFLSDAGVWVNASSSKGAKTDFAAVDASAVLDKVAALPITTWRYREGEGAVRHIGPMAEDFHAAFDVGYGPRTIADLDARGVALAAIQGLNAKVDERAARQASALAERDARIASLEKSEEGWRREIAELKATVALLLARTAQLLP